MVVFGLPLIELYRLTHCFLLKAARLKRDRRRCGQRRGRIFLSPAHRRGRERQQRSLDTDLEGGKGKGSIGACRTSHLSCRDCFQVIVEWEETEALVFFLLLP